MKLGSLMRPFFKCNQASATVEFVLWVPLLLFFMLAAVDLTLVMHRYQMLYNEAYNTSRSVAVGAVTSSEAASDAYIRVSGADSYNDADSELSVEVNISGGFVTSTITQAFSGMSSLLASSLPGSLTGSATLWVEATAEEEDENS